MKIPLQHPQNLRPADTQLGRIAKFPPKIISKFVKLTACNNLTTFEYEEHEEHEMTGNGSNANLLKLFFVKSH